MLTAMGMVMEVGVQHTTSEAVATLGDDRLLVQQARTDGRRFATLYRRYVDHIYRFHLMRTGSADDAQELTSLTFLAALESLDRYSGSGSFAGWLFGIARHKLADFHRRRRHELPLDAGIELAHAGPSPDEVALQRLQLQEAAVALRRLSPEQAEAVTLRVFGQLSSAEVGRIMGKSDTAVRMLVYRALQRLRQELAADLEVSE